MIQENNFTGYILAGGKSSRMGKDKTFLEIGGRTFLKNAIDALKPNCSQVKIVINKAQKHFIEKFPADVSYIFDIFENRGAPGGIHAALKDCKTEFAVILAVDLPFISHNEIDELCEIALNLTDFSAFVPRQNDGRLQPLCAVYQVNDCLPKVEEILSKTVSASMKDFLAAVNIKTISVKYLCGNEQLFANINSPQDFVKIHSPQKFAG